MNKNNYRFFFSVYAEANKVKSPTSFISGAMRHFCGGQGRGRPKAGWVPTQTLTGGVDPAVWTRLWSCTSPHPQVSSRAKYLSTT